MKLLNKTPAPEGFMVPVSLDSWYDRSTRSWVVQTLDTYGNQVGDADYCGTRGQRDACMEARKADLQADMVAGGEFPIVTDEVLATRRPCFVARDPDGQITGMYEPSVCDRANFRMVYGIARHQCETGGWVEVIATS